MNSVTNWWERPDITAPENRPEFLKQVYQALGDPDWQRRNAFIAWLQGHLANDVIEVLFHAIADEDNANRRNAALQVLTHAGRQVIPMLKKIMSSSQDDVRLFAVQLAGNLRSPELLNDLLLRLSDSRENIRVAAIEALGSLGNLQPQDVLLKMAEMESDWVAFQAILALGQIGHIDALKSLHTRIKQSSQALRAQAFLTSLPSYLEPEALQWFMEAMAAGQGNHDVLIHSIRWFEPELLEADLLTYIRTFQSWLQQVPESILQQFRSLSWQQWLQVGIDDLHRATLYWGLILDIPEIVNYIHEHLHDPQWVEHIRTLIPWTAIAEENTWIRFWLALDRSDMLHLMVTARSEWIQRADFQRKILDRWDDLELDTQTFILDRVLNTDSDFTPTLVAWLEQAWSSMNPVLDDQVYAWLQKRLASDRRRHQWEEQAQAWIADPEPWKRAVAVELYLLLGETASPPVLRQAMHDVHPWVRFIAVKALNRVSLDKDTRSMILQNALTDEHPGVRESAVRVYPLEDEKFPTVIQSMFHDPELWVKVAVIHRAAETKDARWLQVFKGWYEREPETPVCAEILRWISVFDEPEVLRLYQERFMKAEVLIQRAIAEGLSRFIRHRDAAEALTRRLLDEANLEDLSVRLRLLETLAELNRATWEAWMKRHLDELETLHQWTDLVALLDRAGVKHLPDWCAAWLHRPESWPFWIRHLKSHPEWLPQIQSMAPWRLQRLIQILAMETDNG